MGFFGILFCCIVSIAAGSRITRSSAEAEIRSLQSTTCTTNIDASLWHEPVERITPDSRKKSDLSLLTSVFPFTSVFTVDDDPDIVVIYRQFCHISSASIDPSVKYFWFLQHLESLHVSPKVHALSNFARGEDLARSPAGSVDKLILQKCPYGMYTRVRYMVMERALGAALDELVSEGKTFSIIEAVSIGAKLIRALEQIHAKNVIHGDIHWGNVMFDSAEIQLIDFENASVYDPAAVEESVFPCGASFEETLSAMHSLAITRLNTFWESQSCAKSFRDDMYRGLVVIATLIHGVQYDEFIASLANGTPLEQTRWVMHKAAGHIFELDRFEVPANLQPKFHQLTGLVTRLGMHEPPPYVAVLRLLDEIAALELATRL